MHAAAARRRPDRGGGLAAGSVPLVRSGGAMGLLATGVGAGAGAGPPRPGLPLCRAARRRTGGVVAAVAAHPLPPGGRRRPAHRHYRHPHRPGRDLGGNGCRCRSCLHRPYLPAEPRRTPHRSLHEGRRTARLRQDRGAAGGIYALERLMRDSSTDQPTIVEVLAAYIRQHASLASLDEARTADSLTSPFSPDADVQAALTV